MCEILVMVFVLDGNISTNVLNNVVSPYVQVARARTNFEENSLLNSTCTNACSLRSKFIYLHSYICTQPSSLAIAARYPSEHLVFVPLPFTICVFCVVGELMWELDLTNTMTTKQNVRSCIQRDANSDVGRIRVAL